jgi:hypothetical protein
MDRISPPRRQNHQGHPPTLLNAKVQRREDAKPTRPPRPEMRDARSTHLPKKSRDAETQRRRESDTDIHRVARFPAVQRRPGNAGPRNRRESELSCRLRGPASCALGERRPRHYSSPFNGREGRASSPLFEEEERQNRRAHGTSAGEKSGGNGCSHPEASGFSPAAGDPIACRSAGNKRCRISCSAFAPLHLCVFAGWMGGRALRLRGFLGGRVALRLRVSAPLRFLLCAPLCVSVPLWFFVRRNVGIVE